MAEQQTPFTLRDHFDELAMIVGKAVSEALEEQRARAVEARANGGAAPPLIAAAKPKPNHDKSLALGRLVRYLAQSKNDVAKARDIAHRAGDAFVADNIFGKAASKAMAEDTLASGGALVMGEFAEEVIETLRAESVVRRAGPRIVPMESGTLVMPFGDTASSASYTGETSTQNETTSTTGQLELRARKLRITSAVSNDLLRDTSGRGDAFVRDDVAGAIGEREDYAFLLDNGTSGTPKGMWQWASDVSNTVAANATVNVANVTIDLGKAMLFPMEDKVQVRRAAWFFAPRTWNYLSTARTTDGHLVWEPTLSAGTLNGWPWFMSSQIPTNEGAGSNESRIIFAEMNGAMIAETTELEIAVYEGGAYSDSSGTLQSGIARDETVVRAVERHDFGARYRGKEFGTLSGAKWGA